MSGNGHLDAVDSALLEEAINRLGGKCEIDWLSARGLKNYNSQFLEHGYFVIPIPAETAEIVKQHYCEENQEPLSPSSYEPGYLISAIDEAGCAQMNRQNLYYGKPAPEIIAALNGYFRSISDQFEEQMAHGWRIGNMRMWAVKPGADYGSNTWHGDGFSRYVRKILLFLNPPGRETGTIEIATRKNEVFPVEASTPVALLLDTAVLAHRGLPPKSGVRPAIEVTVIPAQKTDSRCSFAGQNARLPLDTAKEEAALLAQNRYVPEVCKGTRIPSWRKFRKNVRGSLAGAARSVKRQLKDTKARRKQPADTNYMKCVNIGGGRRWQHKGWINLEGAPGPANKFPFWFAGDTSFPIPSSSIQLVYSSHFIEHVDDPTVGRMLSEARRVLSKSDGALLLKFHDFDELMERWRADDWDYFHNTIRHQKISATWPSRNVEDTVDNCAAYVFCGFWNSAFGHNFTGKRNQRVRHPDAYNGPPPQAAAMAHELKHLESAHEIATRLRKAVVVNEVDYTFNHQNAWNRTELIELLARSGFRVVSLDRPELIERFSNVPGIEQMAGLSLYCHAVPD